MLLNSKFPLCSYSLVILCVLPSCGLLCLTVRLSSFVYLPFASASVFWWRTKQRRERWTKNLTRLQQSIPSCVAWMLALPMQHLQLLPQEQHVLFCSSVKEKAKASSPKALSAKASLPKALLPSFPHMIGASGGGINPALLLLFNPFKDLVNNINALENLGSNISLIVSDPKSVRWHLS